MSFVEIQHSTVETLFETENKVDISFSKILAWIRLLDDECIIASLQVGDHRRAVTFEGVREKTLKAEKMMKLTQYFQAGFPNTNDNLPEELHEFWVICYSLFMIDKVNMRHER